VGARALHVVFGGGQVGGPLATRLLAAGERVRVVRRSAGAAPVGAELARGDAADASFCIEAGAVAAYHCLAPPDDRSWGDVAHRFADNLSLASARAGARLVLLDDVRLLTPGGRRLDEDSPLEPATPRGEVVARVQRRLLEAHRRGEVRAVFARAADLYGPGVEHGPLGADFWRAAMDGRAVDAPADPDALRSHHHVNDVAAALAALGRADADVLGRVFLVPCAPATSTRAVVEAMANALGRPVLLRCPGPFSRALDAMRPHSRTVHARWTGPLVVDDRRFRLRFPELAATPLAQGARDTVAWALGRFGAPPAGARYGAPRRPYA
jgi:nucleoside-diphosphate-sugar epimerase